MEKRKLAEVQEYPWYNVEKNTADQFMLYLALEFGKLENINAIPVTDDYIYHDLFKIREQNNYDLELIISNIRPVILNSILPTPTIFPDPRDIMSFKEDHRDELLNLRKDIETNLIYLASIDFKKRSQAISLFKSEKEKEIKEIKMHMKSYDWKINMCKFAGYSIATLGAINAICQNDPISAFSATAGILPSLYQDMLQKKNVNPNSMAYSVLAQQKFH